MLLETVEIHQLNVQRQIITCKAHLSLVGGGLTDGSYLSGILNLFGSERVAQRRKLYQEIRKNV